MNATTPFDPAPGQRETSTREQSLQGYPWATSHMAYVEREEKDGRIHFKGWVSNNPGRPKIALIISEDPGVDKLSQARWRVFLSQQSESDQEPLVKGEKEMTLVGFLGQRTAKDTGRIYLGGPVLSGWARVFYSNWPRKGKPPYVILFSQRVYQVQESSSWAA